MVRPRGVARALQPALSGDVAGREPVQQGGGFLLDRGVGCPAVELLQEIVIAPVERPGRRGPPVEVGRRVAEPGQVAGGLHRQVVGEEEEPELRFGVDVEAGGKALPRQLRSGSAKVQSSSRVWSAYIGVVS